MISFLIMETPNQVDPKACPNVRIKTEASDVRIDTEEQENGRLKLILDLPNELYSIKIKPLRKKKKTLQLIKEERLTVKSEGDDLTVIKVERLTVDPNTEVQFIKAENRYNPKEVFEISEEEGPERDTDLHKCDGDKSAKKVGRKEYSPSTSTGSSTLFKNSNQKHSSLGLNKVTLGPSIRLLENNVSNEQTILENRLTSTSNTFSTGKSITTIASSVNGKFPFLRGEDFIEVNKRNQASSSKKNTGRRSPPVRLRKAPLENVSYKAVSDTSSSDDSDAPQSGWSSKLAIKNKRPIHPSVKEAKHKRSSALKSEGTKKVYAAKYVETHRPISSGIQQHKPIIKRYKPRTNLVYKAVSDTDTEYSSSSDEEMAKKKKTPNKKTTQKSISSVENISSQTHTRKPQTTFHYPESDVKQESLPDVVPHKEGTPFWNKCAKGSDGPLRKKIKMAQATFYLW